MRYGYQVEPVVIGKDYILGGLGSLPKDAINESKDWRDYLPVKELQNRNLETFACVAFTTLNCVETLAKFLYGQDLNWSDRYLAKVSDTQTRGGNSPQNVAEYLRKVGCIPEGMWPYESKSFDEYYSTIPAKLHETARIFNKEYEFKHEYVPTSPVSLVEALKLSPLGVSVPAWYKNDKGLFYRPEGMNDNHYTTLVNYKKDEYWEIWDTYDSVFKKLAWDIGFKTAKRYYIKEREQTKLSWWERSCLWRRIKSII